MMRTYDLHRFIPDCTCLKGAHDELHCEYCLSGKRCAHKECIVSRNFINALLSTIAFEYLLIALPILLGSYYSETAYKYKFEDFVSGMFLNNPKYGGLTLLEKVSNVFIQICKFIVRPSLNYFSAGNVFVYFVPDAILHFFYTYKFIYFVGTYYDYPKTLFFSFFIFVLNNFGVGLLSNSLLNANRSNIRRGAIDIIFSFYNTHAFFVTFIGLEIVYRTFHYIWEYNLQKKLHITKWQIVEYIISKLYYSDFIFFIALICSCLLVGSKLSILGTNALHLGSWITYLFSVSLSICLFVLIKMYEKDELRNRYVITYFLSCYVMILLLCCTVMSASNEYNRYLSKQNRSVIAAENANHVQHTTVSIVSRPVETLHQVDENSKFTRLLEWIFWLYEP